MYASLVIINANVITLNPKQRRAQAIAVQDGLIVAVGSNIQIRKHIGNSTKIIDAKKRTVIPGFVDCHIHMTEFGFFLERPDLRNARSIKEMRKKLRKYASKKQDKGWLLGGRWDHEKFIEKRFPTRWDLDAAADDRPVFLVRVCGHIGVANSLCLRLAGITRETLVDGGKIGLDESTGEPNGILMENAMNLVKKIIPKPDPKDLEEAASLACTKAVEAGLTGVHWLVESLEELQALKKLDSEGRLPLRVYLGIAFKLLPKLAVMHHLNGDSSSNVKIGFIKLFADGSLGSRTAALAKPYSDMPASKGMLFQTTEKLGKLISEAHKAGFQVAVHAIGDRAVASVLDAYEETLRYFPQKNHRHRIEHCSVLNPELIDRLKGLDLVASVQPHFIASDFWLIDRLGKERVRWVYPFKDLKKKGVVLASGSDGPIEPISPLLGIWAATAKRGSKENLPVKEALETYTINAAYASFDEDRKGTIQVGKVADLTVLSNNLFSLKPEMIREVVVEMTIVNGKTVYAHHGSN